MRVLQPVSRLRTCDCGDIRDCGVSHWLFFVAPFTAQSSCAFSRASWSAFLLVPRCICAGDADDADAGIAIADTSTDGDGGVAGTSVAGIVDVPLDAELFRDCGCLRLEPQYEELL